MSSKQRRIVVVSAAIIRDGAYLITQRSARAVLPLLWEFPGGKVEPGETHEEALVRELHYRLGVEAEVREQISEVEREYHDYIVHLHLYRCEIGDSAPKPLSVRALAWAPSGELGNYEFTPADEQSMTHLLFDE